MAIKIFLDTCDMNEIEELIDRVDGITTNPSIMRKQGVTDYEAHSKAIIQASKGKPVSIEVIADDFKRMERQARKIAGWGENVYVKIPLANTRGDATVGIARKLALDGVKLNVTAITAFPQMLGFPLAGEAKRIASIFCGRIADTGVDPVRVFAYIKSLRFKNTEFLWASSREVLNIYQAEKAGADIITVTPELFRKYEKMKGYDLNQLSLDTVKMFYDDAKASGYLL